MPKIEPIIKRKRDHSELDLVPGAWPRFERFIKEIAEAGPQHRTRDAPPKSMTRKGVQAQSKKARKSQPD